jgi:NAD+ synthase (glutamine-hydrolysing)
MCKLRIALAQIDTKLGDVEVNLEKHLELIDAAQSENSHLIVFPELSLTGYYLQDLTPTVARQPTTGDPCFKP